MITELFSELSRALQGSFQLALGAAFLWGVLSILLSPCHLSSIPLVVGYMNHQSGTVNPKRAFSISSLFAVGILLTIVIVGVITASLGRLIGDIGFTGNIIMAIVFILIGFYLMDIIKWEWSGFSPTRIRIKGIVGAFILGLLFGVGVGPCTFAYMAPVLGVVFHISQENLLHANTLLVAFGIGHISIIVAAGTLTTWVQNYLNWSEEHHAMTWMKRTCGLLVVAAGVYLMYQNI